MAYVTKTYTDWILMSFVSHFTHRNSALFGGLSFSVILIVSSLLISAFRPVDGEPPFSESSRAVMCCHYGVIFIFSLHKDESEESTTKLVSFIPVRFITRDKTKINLRELVD